MSYQDIYTSLTNTNIANALAPPSGNKAKWMHERIVRSIDAFEKSLDQDHEVGAYLVSFGTNITFHIQDVSYWGPDMIMFIGEDSNGKKLELLQHISQLNVLLLAVDKLGKEPRRIGFRITRDLPAEQDDQE